MKILDGTDIGTLFESLINILEIPASQIHKYLKSQIENYKIDIDHFLESMFGELSDEELERKLKIDSLMVFHLTTMLSDNQFKDGMKNLRILFEEDENSLKQFLRKYNVKLEVENDMMVIKYNNKILDCLDHALLSKRLRKDQCVNGFLFRNDIENNPDVEHIMRCPELIENICSCIHNRTMEKEWEIQSIPAIIKFKVDFDDVDFSTFQDEGIYEDDFTQIDKYKFLIQIALNFLFYKMPLNMIKFDSDYNRMIFLKESVNISAWNIVFIEKIERRH